MIIGGVSNVYYTTRVTNPGAITAAVAAVQASRPDLAGSQLSDQISQGWSAQQRAVIAPSQDVTGVADTGGLDIYA